MKLIFRNDSLCEIGGAGKDLPSMKLLIREDPVWEIVTVTSRKNFFEKKINRILALSENYVVLLS